MSRERADAGQDPRQQVTALTTERVLQCLVAHGFRVLLDDDGDPTGVWGSNRFWFLRLSQRRDVVAGQQRGVVFDAHRGARRFGAAFGLPGGGGRVDGGGVRRGRPRCPLWCL